MEAHLWRASLLWRAVDGISAKALLCQCFIESTSNVSFADITVCMGLYKKVLSMSVRISKYTHYWLGHALVHHVLCTCRQTMLCKDWIVELQLQVVEKHVNQLATVSW